MDSKASALTSSFLNFKTATMVDMVVQCSSRFAFVKKPDAQTWAYYDTFKLNLCTAYHKNIPNGSCCKV